jgi:hypothetical protein
MKDLIELVAPGGCDEVNHGAERYRVDNNGRVRVPREAAFWMIRSAGFRVYSPDEPIIASADPGLRPESITAPQQSGDGAEPADPRLVPRRSNAK